MRVMGLDYGGATMGVAISDELLITAQPIETIRRENENQMRKTYRRIEELIEQYDVQTIILGYPLRMNDTVGDRALASEKCAEDLRRHTGLPVILWDERLTTVEAHRILDEAGMHYRKKAEVVDKLAASIILQSWLDEHSAELKNNA